MRRELAGRARVVGDDINTDYIISSTRKRETIDERLLTRYLLETVDPGFAATVRPSDLLVAGRNFGCGSAMEIAATVILRAGIKAVLARSFARTFYRNAVNNGLIPIECETGRIVEGDQLRIVLDESGVVVDDPTQGFSVSGPPMPEIMMRILEAGGLVGFVKGGGLG
jgi:3-isopropylmalate/(R)-2-methylmalate dehydratase small subunit